MGKWSKLPEHLVRCIEENLVLYADKVRIRSVCTSWNSYFLEFELPQFPCLLQALNNKNSAEASHGLFNLVDKKFYLLNLPEAQGKMFKGSSHGWLVTLNYASSSSVMHLINPLTRAKIQLPPRSKFNDVIDYCVDRVRKEYDTLDVDGSGSRYCSSIQVHKSWTDKVILSSSPSSKGWVAVAIYGECPRLAYCKCNDKQWTGLKGKGYADVIFHKGKLHAITSLGELMVFEDIGPNSKPQKVAKPPHDVYDSIYLVESSDGCLIMVERRIDVDASVKGNKRVFALLLLFIIGN
ncbi:hypothetical protein LguiB_033076 [Lonicera macranthoides]